jgi:hypothetical protein
LLQNELSLKQDLRSTGSESRGKASWIKEKNSWEEKWAKACTNKHLPVFRTLVRVLNIFFNVQLSGHLELLSYRYWGQIYPVNLEAIKTMKHHNMELGNSNETIAFK